MLPNKKIQAYTLSELIVVIIITSIIAGLSFSVLNLVHRHMDSIALNLDRDMQLKQTELMLNIDFNAHSKITLSDSNKLKFKIYNDSVVYKFNEGLLLRDDDSITLIIEGKSFYFKGQEVKRGRVDAIELNIRKTDDNVDKLFIYKQNDALNKLNYGY
jgi:type II secretory pathway component PulJ